MTNIDYPMDKKVFVSHSSRDEEIVSSFVEKILIAGCGIKREDIMYTSCEEMGVGNGEDIPIAIKQCILGCQVFVMMVSDNYRRSEVCMNEMGAAWITESIKKCILLLPGVGFDKMGWLFSLNKANRLDEEDGLNRFHDSILTLLGLPIMTSTWNMYRSEFLSSLQSVSVNDNLPVVAVPVYSEEEDDDELDLLGIRERFDNYVAAYVKSLNVLTESLSTYSEQVTNGSQKLNRYNENPKTFNAGQVRGIFTALAQDTNHLVDIQEEQNPILKNSFDGLIKYAILLLGLEVDSETKKQNEDDVNTLIDSVKGARIQIAGFKDSLDDVPDLDRSFTKSKNRLKKSLEDLLSTLSFCVGRANELLL